MKFENQSRKQSHELDGIGVGRIRTVPFSSNSTYNSDAYDPVKTRLSEMQAEVLGLFFGFHLRLRQSRFHWIIRVRAISGIGRKWNRSDTAYDSDSDSNSVASKNQPKVKKHFVGYLQVGDVWNFEWGVPHRTSLPRCINNQHVCHLARFQ